MDLVQQAAVAEQMCGPAYGPLRAAITATAISIMNEPSDQPNHEARQELAHRALRGGVTDAFAWAVATNSTVVDKWIAGDESGAWGDVPFVLSTVWDALALSWTGIN